MPSLAIVAARILGFDEAARKHLDHIDKVDAMLEDVGLALRLIPFESHSVY